MREWLRVAGIARRVCVGLLLLVVLAGMAVSRAGAQEAGVEPADRAVPPIWSAAEAFPGNARVRDDAGAGRGKAAFGKRWYVLMRGVPVPWSSRPLYCHVRIRNTDWAAGNVLQLRVERTVKQVMPLPQAADWLWVRFPEPVYAADLGRTVDLVHSGQDTRCEVGVDSMFFTSDENVVAPGPEWPGSAEGVPLVAASRAEAPPVVDGLLDDPSWNGGVEVGHFLIVKGEEPAAEQTRVLLAYDEENLYVAFTMDAECLDPVNNRLNDFKRSVTENDDARLFRDDFALLLLQPDLESDVVYDLAFNANGAVCDARCSGTDLWNSRDMSWNSGVRVAARVNAGNWVLECAIPWSGLGGMPPAESTWGLCLGRSVSATRQSSAWCRIRTGFHDPSAFGRLRFAGRVPGVRGLQLPPPGVGSNPISGRLQPGQDGSVRLTCRLEREEGAAQRMFADVAVAPRETEIALEYELSSDGPITLQCTVADPHTLELWYRSPMYASRVQSSVLQQALTGARTQLYVNGKQATDRVALLRGRNVVAIEGQGAIGGAVSVGEHAIAVGPGWRMSRSREEGWEQPEFDDSAWDILENEPLPAEGAVFLRRSVLLNSSRFWPNWETSGLFVAQDSVQQLFYVPEGVPGMTLDGAALQVEVPVPMRVLGASGYYGTTPVTCTETGTASRDGEEYRVYTLAFEKPIRAAADTLRAHQFIAILLDVPLLETPRESARIHYYATAAGGSVVEVPRQLTLHILPPLRGRQPQTYAVQIWSGWMRNLDHQELQGPLLESLAKAGCNETSHRWDASPIPRFELMNFNDWCLDCRPYLVENPEHALVDAEGTRHLVPDNGRMNHICPSLLVGDTPAWEFVAAVFQRWMVEKKLEHVHWDYESSVYTSYISCYCERCLAAFRESAQLPPALPLTPERIREEHAPAWIAFMNQRFADLATRFCAEARRAQPPRLFSVYSGYQSESTRERYGIDWRLLAGRIDRAACGYGRPVQALADTLEALGDTPLVCGEIVYPYDTRKLEEPGFASKATLLRRCIDGTGGYLIYTLTELDGRTFYASAEVSRLVADYEGVFLKHLREDDLVQVSGLGAGNVAVLTADGVSLVMVLNEGRAPARGSLSFAGLPPGSTVLDYYAEQPLAADGTLRVEVGPEDARVFVVRRP